MADFEAEFPPVTPGSVVLVQVKHTRYTNPDGSVGWLNFPPGEMTVRDREDCRDDDGDEHTTTICTECIPEWAMDHYIELVTADGSAS